LLVCFPAPLIVLLCEVIQGSCNVRELGDECAVEVTEA
jgi:hypothetical protein